MNTPGITDAFIGVRGGEVSLRAASVESRTPSLRLYDAGPVEGKGSFADYGGAGARMDARLERPLGEQGTLSFWVRPGKWFSSGPGRPTERCDILEIPGVGKCYFQQASSDCLLAWDWDWDVVSGADWLGVHVPALPGPEWYFITYTWDAARGLFDGYVNGSPLKVPGLRGKPWSMSGGDRLTLHAGLFRIADVSVSDRYLPQDEARAMAPDGYRGRRADEFGSGRPAQPIDLTGRLGRVLYETPMADADDIRGWRMEGPGVTRFADGWMEVSSALKDGQPKGHIVHWCPQDFPESFVAEWDFRQTSEYGLCIVFFSARGAQGEDILSGGLPERDGTFGQYTRGPLNCYHISYTASTPGAPGRITSNLRKNSGFHLVTNGPPGVYPGDTAVHRVRLIRDGGHIQCQVDERVIIDWLDDGRRYGPVLPGGKIGLRQMEWTIGQYRNFRVQELHPED